MRIFSIFVSPDKKLGIHWFWACVIESAAAIPGYILPDVNNSLNIFAETKISRQLIFFRNVPLVGKFKIYSHGSKILNIFGLFGNRKKKLLNPKPLIY
jgi:hypothetical protein